MGEIVGTMLINQITDFHEGENDYIIKLHSDSLSPGDYQINIVAYYEDEFGNEVSVDNVVPACVISVKSLFQNANDSNQNLVWLSQYWGKVRLQDLELVSSESSNEE